MRTLLASIRDQGYRSSPLLGRSALALYSHLIVARIVLDQQSTRANELISGDWNVDNSTGHLRTDGHDAGIDEGIVSRFIFACVPPPDHDGNVAESY